MPRYLIKVEYDGTNFSGWQRQDNVITVQEVIETAIENLTQQPIVLYVSGRTDAGVHAMGQMAHFDCHKSLKSKEIQNALNYYLKKYPVKITHVQIVSKDFHARFDAIERQYLYRILVRDSPPALEENRVWWVTSSLDVAKMHDAGQVLLGTHDFSSFRAVGCQATSPIRTIDEINLYEYHNEIRMFIRARSFLYHQVRNIIGTLHGVGTGKYTKNDVKNILESKQRAKAGVTAPSSGLYFYKSCYKDSSLIANQDPNHQSNIIQIDELKLIQKHKK